MIVIEQDIDPVAAVKLLGRSYARTVVASGAGGEALAKVDVGDMTAGGEFRSPPRGRAFAWGLGRWRDKRKSQDSSPR